MSQELEPNRDQIDKFVRAIFRHADGGFVALRSFYQVDNQKFRFSPTPLTGGLESIIDAAEDLARQAAQCPRPVNFCPPLAVFTNEPHARQEDIAAGLTLSVECDRNPNAARAVLEQILGRATVVVKSGGRWVNGGDAAEDKLHLHWRLAKPARDAEALTKLKQARTLAGAIVGGDPTNNPVNHPIRWPGSWHRKAEPRLCEIVELNSEVEIDLDVALATLMEAAPDLARTELATHEPGEPEAAHELVALAVAVIPNDFDLEDVSWDEWVRIGLATYAATGGSDEGFAVFDGWSRKNIQGRYNAANTIKKWNGFHSSPPNRIGCGTLFYLAYQADPHWSDAFYSKIEAELLEANRDAADFSSAEKQSSTQSGKTKEEQPKPKDPEPQPKPKDPEPFPTGPVDLWGKFDPPPLPLGLLPKVIENFAIEQGKLMGADSSGLAMAALTVCATAIPDRIQLQVKKHDRRWRESTRIWTALIGGPSTKKTPEMREAAASHRQSDGTHLLRGQDEV